MSIDGGLGVLDIRVIRLRQSIITFMHRKKVTSKRRFQPNTPAEEARIQAGIKADPDARELTTDELERMRPFREMMEERRRGRPKSTVHKRRKRDEHGVQHLTPAGRSVFRDLLPPEEAAELEIRATLLRGLERWLVGCEMTQTEAAKVLRVTRARVSDIKRGKINQFSLDLLVRLASRAGLRPKIKLTGKIGEREFAQEEAIR